MRKDVGATLRTNPVPGPACDRISARSRGTNRSKRTPSLNCLSHSGSSFVLPSPDVTRRVRNPLVLENLDGPHQPVHAMKVVQNPWCRSVPLAEACRCAQKRSFRSLQLNSEPFSNVWSGMHHGQTVLSNWPQYAATLTRHAGAQPNTSKDKGQIRCAPGVR